MSDLPQGETSFARVHPAANLFPLLGETELAELAEDIAANGLKNAVVRDCEGRILDGRNRYAACIKAGVEPRFETYEGDDPVDFVVSLNVKRRHLTKV
jgi:ParB-like chromosome segregation protein Spo0J